MEVSLGACARWSVVGDLAAHVVVVVVVGWQPWEPPLAQAQALELEQALVRQVPEVLLLSRCR